MGNAEKKKLLIPFILFTETGHGRERNPHKNPTSVLQYPMQYFAGV